jgi:hypothetical protein
MDNTIKSIAKQKEKGDAIRHGKKIEEKIFELLQGL